MEEREVPDILKESHIRGQRQRPRRAILRPRSVAAGRRHLAPKARGGSWEEPPTPEARASGQEEQPKEQAQEGLEELYHS